MAINETDNQNPASIDICVLAGAGAELCYNMPLGGQFSFEIFRNCFATDKETDGIYYGFRDEVRKLIAQENSKKGQDNSSTSINSYSQATAYGQWLPSSGNVKAFSLKKVFFNSILQDTLTHNRDWMIEKLEALEDNSAELINTLKGKLLYQYDPENSKDELPDILKSTKVGKFLGGDLLYWFISFYKYQVNLISKERIGGDDSENTAQASANSVHQSTTLRKKEELIQGLGNIIISFVDLSIAACGSNILSELNNASFSMIPDSLIVNRDKLFKLDTSQLIEGVFSSVYTKFKSKKDDDLTTVILFAQEKLIEVFSSVLDYRSLIDSHWLYLYTPRDEWTSFFRVSVFLNLVRMYILKRVEDFDTENHNGYYHVLAQAAKAGLISISGIATTNYASKIQVIFKESLPLLSVDYLNGSTELYYDPYLNATIEAKDVQNHRSNKGHIVVPLMFTQNGTKPMTSTSMISQYSNTFNKWCNAKCIVTIGFGFSSCDENITSMIREAVQKRTGLIIVTVRDSKKDIKQEFNWYCARLRLTNDELDAGVRDRIKILFVDKTPARTPITSEGKPFIDALIEKINELP